MEDIDTQKLGEILGILSEYKVAAFKCGEFQLVMVTEDEGEAATMIGFDAPSREDADDDAEDRAPVGYKTLFKGGFPKFRGIEK